MTVKLLAIGHSYVLSVNRAILRALVAEHGFAVTVAAPEFYAGDLRPLYCEPEPPGSALQLVPLPARASGRAHFFHYAGGALRRLLEQRFDVVGVWEEPYILAGWQVVRAARRHGRARVCFYSCQNLSKRYPPPFSWFERQAVRWSDGWQASGRLVQETLVGRGYDPSRGEVLPLAVDTSIFRPLAAEERRQVLGELGLSAPVVGFVGRLTPQKGIAVLRQALDGLPAAVPWSALFLGSGPEEENILRWAQERGWAGRVHVRLARHDEVPHFLGAMDVLAAPSQTTTQWQEQFGRMLVEAFACGVTVVGSDSGEIPHVVADAGVIVPESDPPRWTAALAALLTDPDRRAQFTRRGLERVQGFSAKSLAAAYARFYRDLLARPSRAAGP